MATTQGSKPAAQAAKPVAQPLNQTLPKTVTNDTTTSTNPANAELQLKSTTNPNTGEKPIAIVEDNISEGVKATLEDIAKIANSNSYEETKEILSKITPTEVPLQNEKNLQDKQQQEIKELQQSLQPKIQIPTAGRVVTFFFAKEDGICTNNMIPSLPATVVLAEGLITNLAVFTLDSRDPVVLRKAIPHISITQKDSEDDPIRPFWDWPVIVR